MERKTGSGSGNRGLLESVDSRRLPRETGVRIRRSVFGGSRVKLSPKPNRRSLLLLSCRGQRNRKTSALRSSSFFQVAIILGSKPILHESERPLTRYRSPKVSR